MSHLDDKIWLKALNVDTIPLLLLSHHRRAALKVHKSIGNEIRNISTIKIYTFEYLRTVVAAKRGTEKRKNGKHNWCGEGKVVT